MNQNHGVELLNFHRNELCVQNCSIEDNFCDGFHVSSEEVEDPIVREDLLKLSVSKRKLKSKILKNEVRIRLTENKIHSNKNSGLNLIQLDEKTYVTLIKNSFYNNLCTDIQVNEKTAYSRLQFVRVSGEDSNKLEQSVMKNFMDDSMAIGKNEVSLQTDNLNPSQGGVDESQIDVFRQ